MDRKCVRCGKEIGDEDPNITLTHWIYDDMTFDPNADSEDYCDWFCLALDAAFQAGVGVFPEEKGGGLAVTVDVVGEPDWWAAHKLDQTTVRSVDA